MSHNAAPVSQQIYLSTHNALRLGEADGDDKIRVAVTELGGSGWETVFSVYPFCDVEMVKRLIIKLVGLPKSVNISDIRVFHRGTELPNYRSLTAFGEQRHRNKVRLYWSLKDDNPSVGLRELGIRPPPDLQDTMNELNLAFKRGIVPKMTMDGTGGTYILDDAKRQHRAMFKPRDEEAFTPNNPRGYEGKLGQQGFRNGVLSGEGSIREVAAFLLDAQYGGQAGVPQTTKIEACHPNFCYRASRPSEGSKGDTRKGSALSGGLYHNFNFDAGGPAAQSQLRWKEGSLQLFVEASDCCGDFDSRVFSIADAHRIACFDIRVLNLDRNDGNLLVVPSYAGSCSSVSLSSNSSSAVPLLGSSSEGAVRRAGGLGSSAPAGRGGSPKSRRTTEADLLTPEGKQARYRLVPIDHGLVLPDTMDVGDVDLVWYYWPHVKIPMSEEQLRHIYLLDPDRDAVRLSRKLELRDECLRTMRVATRVLQIGARMHLNLFQIASLVVRFDDFDKPSVLERLVKTALLQAYTAVDSTSLIRHNRININGLVLDLQLAQKPVRETKGSRGADSSALSESDSAVASTKMSSKSYSNVRSSTSPIRCASLHNKDKNQSGAEQSEHKTTRSCSENDEIRGDHRRAISFSDDRLSSRPTAGSFLLGNVGVDGRSAGLTAISEDGVPAAESSELAAAACVSNGSTSTASRHLHCLTANSSRPFELLDWNEGSLGSGGLSPRGTSSSASSTPSSSASSSFESSSSDDIDSGASPCGSTPRRLLAETAAAESEDAPMREGFSRISGVPLGSCSPFGPYRHCHRKRHRDKKHKTAMPSSETSSGVPPRRLPTDQTDVSCSNRGVNGNAVPSNDELGPPVTSACLGSSPALSAPAADCAEGGKNSLEGQSTSLAQTGPTLDAAASDANTRPQAGLTTGLLSTASGGVATRRKATGAFVEFGTRTTTATRRRTAARQRRGTAAHTALVNTNSTWLLLDGNKQRVPLDWDTSLFEKTFFDSFELLIKHYIAEQYPDWQSYPYNGARLERELLHHSRHHDSHYHHSQRRHSRNPHFDKTTRDRGSGV